MIKGGGCIVSTVKVGIIGIGGYGMYHLDGVEAMEKDKVARLSAVAEINYKDNSEKIEELKARGVAYYQDWQDIFKEELGLVTIATPIPFHREMVVEALKRDLNVVCEKPAAATIQDVQAMVDAEDASKGICEIGYKHVNGTAFKRLNDLMYRDRLGAPKDIVVVGLLQRQDSYFSRSSWAGKLMLGDRFALDGPMTNAMSHLVNHALYLAHPEHGVLAEPKSVRAELYRAHSQIEVEDTECINVKCSNGVNIFIYLTYCASGELPLANRYIELVCENGTAKWTMENTLTVHYNDGSREEYDYRVYGKPSTELMIRNMADIASGKKGEPFSPLRESKKVVLSTNGAYYSSKSIFKIPDDFITRKEERDSVSTIVKGLEDLILKAANNRELFSDMDIPWAKKTEEFDLTGFSEFRLDDLEL